MDIFADLAAEHEAFARLARSLSTAQWHAPSRCANWTVGQVVLHLALTEEAVVGSLDGAPEDWAGLGPSVAAAMNAQVAAFDRPGPEVLDRWAAAAARSLARLAATDRHTRVRWVTNSMRPGSLATTRLAEHWAHAHDIADPMGLPYPDTERLRHLLWLAVATLPYAFAVDGQRAPSVRCVASWTGDVSWTFGPEDAGVVLTGPAGDLAAIASRRLDPAAAPAVRAEGPGAAEVLDRLRFFAV